MTNRLKRGTPESVWPVARRCLAVINRLQQGPATKEELLDTIYRAENPNASETAVADRFEKDKSRLWHKLGVKIGYDKSVEGYVIKERERPLLNLSEAGVETLAFLADTFQEDSPHAAEVQQLIDQLVDWLPGERQKLFRWLSGQQPTADLRQRDSEEIPADVWEVVLEAWQAKQELQFEYLSSQHEDGVVRFHHVQPWDLYFTDRGHWHLRGFCLLNEGPFGRWHPNDYINYRVSRIVPGSAKLLPRKLPGVRPHGRQHEVIFELAPTVARFGVSLRKELTGEPEILPLDDSWVRVTGKTYDVFHLARNLLYYGKNCRVLGGEKLLAEMRRLVSGLVEVYR